MKKIVFAIVWVLFIISISACGISKQPIQTVSTSAPTAAPTPTAVPTPAIKSGEVNLMDVCPPYDGSHMDIEYIHMGGKEYNGFRLSDVHDVYALINLNDEYSSVSMYIGSVDGKPKNYGNAEVYIYLDNTKVQTYTIDPKELPTYVTIPIAGAKQMKIEVKNPDWLYSLGFGDIILKY